MSESREQAIQGLRDLAKFLERNPDVPLPSNPQFNVFVHDREALTALARLTSWEKVYNGEWFSLRRTFGGGLEYDINASRDTVCRKVVTGTKIIPAQPEREVEEIEWVCEESLLGAAK